MQNNFLKIYGENGSDWGEIICPDQTDWWKNIEKGLKLISNVKLPRSQKMTSINCYALAMHQEKHLEQQFIWDLLKKIKYRLASPLASQELLLIMNYQYLDLNYLLLLTVLFRARSLNFVEKTLPLKIKEMIFWTYSKCILL